MIKKANKQNIENISKLIYDAIHEVANSLTGENEEHKILKTLENYIQMDVCRLSYNNIYTYEVNNKNVAILLAYNSNDIEKLDKPMIEHLKTKNIFLESFDKECFEDEFYIDTVSVLEDYQGQGIAKELFAFAQQKAREQGFKKLSLLVDLENKKAKALYEKLGFLDNTTLEVSKTQFSHMIKEL
ncbi:GNAT family N-acetyltransferase [Aliarcobacter skirrowii]|uniref:GNAT family N-acetyltransferase n=1 Tax=Aliarcobacter skirrowii TaxID=28200 RepID=UPI0029B73E89|nr:GNAT family N-acetyltransferase [Aliarcobacter skirrowii]MDX4048287.1 GNAT family N-acetyltransferase [Aliarcobacter skirrowii]MDX4067405.1 GNAT family N-acetyltransferase [Aliarcobacter skirrowii]